MLQLRLGAAAAAAAKSLQLCPTLCDPLDGSPPGSPLPGILQTRMEPKQKKYPAVDVTGDRNKTDAVKSNIA